MSKKRLALLLSFAMISSFTAPAYAEAADFSAEATAETAEVYEAEDHADDDDDIIAETADAEAEDSAVEENDTETDTETETVTVPAALADDDAEYLTADWYDWDSVNGILTLKNQLPDTFYDGYDPDRKYYHGLAYLANINAGDIKKIVITSGTKAGMNASYMFCHMTNLTEIEGLDELDTSSATDMSFMFWECSSLTSIDIQSFNTSSVTDMSGMFQDCSSLASLDLSSFDTSSVTYMSQMFSGCSSLTSLDLSSFDTSSVKNMAVMFADCSSLVSVDLSSFDTANVKSLHSMFRGCSSLTSLDLSSFDTSSVTYMQNMFNGCSSLTTITVSDKWNTENVTSSANMFKDCTALVGGNGTTFDSSHTDKEYARIDGGTSAPGYLTEKWYSWDASTGTLTLRGQLPDTKYDGTDYNLAYYAGIDNDAINKIVITSGTKAGTSAQAMFSKMKNLIAIEGLDNLDTSNVTDMSRMFWDCTSLKSLEFSSFVTSSVTDMSSMFTGCSSLTDLSLSSFDTSSVTNMAYMFYGCSSLTALDLSSFDTSSVKKMQCMFYKCSSLTTLKIASFDTSAVEYMVGMFYGCSSLTALDLSSFDTANATEMQGMFYDCSALKTITVSDKWNTDKAKNTYMFNGCTALVGGCGTEFDSNHIDKTYALIDRGTNGPGYLTASCTYVDVDSNTLHLVGEFNKPGETENTIAKALEKAGKSKDDIYEIVADKNAVFPADSSYLFSEFIYVDNIDLSKADTSAVTNMSGMFFMCKEMKTCSISGIDTSAVTDMNAMFGSCMQLGSVDLSSLDTSAVTNMSSMFVGCESLKSVGLPSDTSAVTDMMYMFHGCSALKTLDLTSFDTSSVTKMQGMFWNCSSLASVNIGSFVTSNVKNMNAMFADCSSLASVDVSSFDTSNVTDPFGMSKMFKGCSSLTTLDLTSFDTSGVTHMKEMFSGCSSLKTITVSDKWNTDNVTSSADMFTGCTALVGGNGTKFDDSHTDKEYARIDGGTSAPGYLTSNVIAVTGVTLNETTADMKPGDTVTLTATVSPDDATDKTVSWSSSDESVATVSDTGVVTAVASGTATITVTTTDGQKTATCAVTVKQPVTGVVLDNTTADMTPGDTLQLTATVSPDNADDKTVSWSSSDESVATVSDAGLVTAVASGTATITVTTTDGQKTATCAVTVKQPVTGVTIPATLDMITGEKDKLTAVIAPDDADDKSVTWSSSDDETVTVDANGYITAVKAGTATITVTTTDGGKTADCTVTVTDPIIVAESVSFIKDTESLAIGETLAVKYTYDPDNADTSTIIWSTSDPAVATVDNGVVTATGVGNCEITAEGGNGKGSPAKMTIIVGASRPGKPTVEINIAFGGRTVKFDCDDEDAVIYYNIGSSNITTECKSIKPGESVFFDKPMTGNNAAIFFKAYNNGLWSPVGKWGVLNVQIAEPIIARSGRPSENNFRVYTQTKKSFIVYTLDGSTPAIEEGTQELKVTNGRLVWGTSTIVKVGEGQTIKAIAVRSGLVTSDVMEYTNQ